MSIRHLVAFTYTLLVLFCFSATAQTVNGTPGSPSATTTIDSKQLPPPDPKFGGFIKDDALQSKPWWAPRDVPRRARPTCCSSSPTMPASACRAPSAA